MKQFTDKKGQAWSIEITIGVAKRVKSLLDVDLIEPEKGSAPICPMCERKAKFELLPDKTFRCSECGKLLEERPAPGPSMMERLIKDLTFVGELIFTIIQPQASTRNIQEADWYELIDGDVVAHAHTALMEELADFFRKSGLTHLARALDVQVKTVKMAIAKLDRKVAAMDPDEMSDRVIPGAPSTKPPASSG